MAECVNGEYIFPSKNKWGRKRGAVVGGISAAMVFPGIAWAESMDTNETFNNVHTAVLNAVDAGVVLVIIFAGASWMLGHRTRAIEILIGVGCGYLIISHAVNLRDFLKSI